MYPCKKLYPPPVYLMKLFFIFLVSFCTFTRSSNININNRNSINKKDPLFSRLAYLRQFESFNYIACILSCLYTVPMIQKAFYDETMLMLENRSSIITITESEKKKSSLTVAFSEVFVMLRTSHSATSLLNKSLLDALKLNIDWEERKTFAATKFWNLLSHQFPPSIKSLFDVKVKIDWINPDSKQLIFSEIQNLTSIKIPVSTSGLSTAALASVNFYDEKYVEAVKDLNDPNSSCSLAIPRITFLNIPEVLVFKIERNIFDPVSGHFITSSNSLHLSNEIEINGTKYILSGKIIVDNNVKKHFADVLDFGNGQFYRHRAQSVVQLIPNQFSDRTERATSDKLFGTLVFYTVKRDVAYDRTFYNNLQDIPDYILNSYKRDGKIKIYNNIQLDKSVSSPKKRKRSTQKKEIEILASVSSDSESIPEGSPIFNTFNCSSSNIKSLIAEGISHQDPNIIPAFAYESTCIFDDSTAQTQAQNSNTQAEINYFAHLDDFLFDDELFN